MHRVLVVDDSEDARFLVSVVLEEETDVEVVGAVGGAAAALEAVVALAPDVVLMDARMPGVDGFELTERVLAVVPEVRVVLLSSLIDPVVEAQATAAGAVACHSKADLDVLADAVRVVAR